MHKMKSIILKLFFVFLLIELLLRITGACYSFLHTHQFFKNKKGKIPILCLGESTTFGIGVIRGKDYPSRLNELLDKKYPDKFLVYNRGIPGITSSQIASQIKQFMKETNPDLVILLSGANEYDPLLNAVTILKDKKYFFSSLLCQVYSGLSNIKTYKFIIAVIDRLKYERLKSKGIIPKYGNCSEFNEQEKLLLKKQYQINVRKITQMIRNEGAEVIYSTYLWSWANYDGIKNTAYRNRAILCDQVEMLKQRGISFSRLINKDGFHPNSLGYNLMAEFLLKTLEESSILLQLLDNEKNKHK